VRAVAERWIKIRRALLTIRRVRFKSLKPYYRRVVTERDGYKCLVADEHAGKIEFHHFFPLEYGGINDEENLIFLCEKHHREAHKELDP